MTAPTVHPHLCLQFVHEKSGVRFDERYFRNDEHRREQDALIHKALFGWFGTHWPSIAPGWAGEPPYTVGVGAAYVIIAALFGAKIRYYDDFHPDCSSEPLAHIREPREIKVPDVENAWPLSEYLARYDALAAKHGRERVVLPGFEFQGTLDPRSRGLLMHSPLTTAYKLRGSQLFVDMKERPDVARRVFSAVRETYYRTCDLLIGRLGMKTDVIFFGACASSWVSPELWREWELPAISEIVTRYGARTILHSCGKSTHLLEAFAGLPRLQELHLGEGTDLAAARRIHPSTGFFIVPDSVAWARNPAAQTVRAIHAMTEAAGSGPLAFQFVLEAGIPNATVEAILRVFSLNS